MQAIVLRAHGGIEQLQLGEHPDPRPAPLTAIVRVRACALNHLDIWVRKGIPGLTVPLPHVPGSDVAGIVESVGEGVTAFKPGDEVVVAPGISCGSCERCAEGQDSLCPAFTILGLLLDGGCAELVRVPAANLLPLPRGLAFEAAAAAPLVFLTAWHMLVGRARIRPGETVLVHAAGSGVGSAAIQIAKLFGARVLTTVGSEEKAAKAREIGADAVIDYRRSDFAHEVLQATGKKGVDVVIEHIGPAVLEQSLLCLARGGRLVTCGATTGPAASFDLRFVFSRQLSILGSYMGNRGELAEALKWIEAGRLHPVVDRVLPLAETARAHQIMEDRQNFGKLVLVPS